MGTGRLPGALAPQTGSSSALRVLVTGPGGLAEVKSGVSRTLGSIPEHTEILN